MIKKLNKYWSLVKEYAILLNCLDPKYKLETLDDDERVYAREKLNNLYNIYQEKYPHVKHDENIKIKNSFFFEESILDKKKLLTKSNSMTGKNELDIYLFSPRLGLEDNTINWWKHNREKFPILSKIAQDYLGP